jgi:hypothetical protein
VPDIFVNNSKFGSEMYAAAAYNRRQNQRIHLYIWVEKYYYKKNAVKRME